MSFYDDASLIMYPSGYKEDKIYSLKPTDGSGDLTFTRASTATRVNAEGLIETSPVNLNTFSESFTSPWGTDGTCTVTNNFATAPNGTTTASKVVSNGGAAYLYKGLSLSPNVHTFSVYIKASANTTTVLSLNDTGGSGAGDQTYSVTTEWQRIEYDQNITDGFSVFMAIGINVGVDYFLWGAQLNIGATAKPYFPTTDRLNVPRIDYTGGGCGKLLLEPQRTNSALFSEQINNAAWGKLNVTVSANQAVGPDGTTSADLVYPTTTGVDRVIEQLPVAVIGQTWTSSFFVKASGFSWVLMYAPNLVTCWFNASTGVFGTIGAGATATVLGQVNGYWRISLTGTVASSNAYLYVGPADANGTTTATANGTNGILIWGCQIELGAYATSYIPTLGAAVTRGADAASKTGISSLIGQTEGTLFADVDLELNGDSAGILAITGVGTTFVYLFTAASTNLLNANVYVNGAQEASMTYTLPSAGRYKIAIGYKTNDFVLYVNGVQRGNDNNGIVPACSDLYINSTTYNLLPNIKHSQALIFPTRLTNTQLASLTTL